MANITVTDLWIGNNATGFDPVLGVAGFGNRAHAQQ